MSNSYCTFWLSHINVGFYKVARVLEQKLLGNS